MGLVPRHEEDRSGWWGNLHIWAPPVVKTPWWATHERLRDCEPGEIVKPDCCLCKMRADETVCQIVTGRDPPLGISDEERRETLWDYYYEPHVNIECAEGFGCTVNRRRRSSRHLRDWSCW